MRRVILIRYGEIGVKGGNRNVFERQLADNCRRAVAGTGAGGVVRKPGRVEVSVPDGVEVAPICERLVCVPGIVWLSVAEPVERTLDAITARVVAAALDEGAPDTASFAIHTRRSDKRFEPDSVGVNRHVGQAVVQATGRPVDLSHPETTFTVEIDEHEAFVATARLPGPGGLPVGVSGKLVALLSGGLDSPVAAHRMQRRGARVIAVHFRNETLAGGRAVESKIRDLCRVLARAQQGIKLWMVPFGDLQRQIIAHVPDRYRMLIYRRVMLRIADRIRFRERAGGLVCGDSLGQVASQTLPNLRVLYEVAQPPVLAPLIGHDKVEIVAEARRIGTYDISIRPHEDCCSYLVPAHPETRAKPDAIAELEAFPMEDLCAAAVQATTPERIEPDWPAAAPTPASPAPR